MVVRDLRIALRALCSAPTFSIVAVLTLALGIGGTSAVFTMVNSIVLQPLPYPAADRLVVIRHHAPGLGLEETPLSDATYLHYQSESRALEDLGYYYENVVNVTGGGDAERVQIAMASPSLLSTLGARAVLGRLLAAEETHPEGVVPVVISHELWSRRFGADPAIIGKDIRLNSVPRVVVGVLEPGFNFPRRDTHIWYGDALNPARAGLGSFMYSTIGRLGPGQDIAEAEAELNRLNDRLPAAYARVTPDLLAQAQLTTSITPLDYVVVGDLSNALWLLLGGMGFVLLIACANVANLFLVRAEHRQKEVAVRSALGASRAALVRYFLAESTLLGVAAGLLGLVLAAAGTRLLVATGPANLPRLHEIELDGLVVAFTAALTMFTALGFAAVPALRYTRPQLGLMLKQHTFGSSTGHERQRVRALLVVMEVALALTLLVGSALMARSFWNLRQHHPGFQADGVFTAEIALPFTGYRGDATHAFWRRLFAGLVALPGVDTVGAVSSVPLVPVPNYYNVALDIEGAPAPDDAVRPVATRYFVVPGYFAALRIPILEGSSFARAPGDDPDGILVSAALARRLFPGERAVGRRLRASEPGDGAWQTIIGVTGDVPRSELTGDPAELIYVPVTSAATTSHLTLTLRTSLPPATLAPAVRALVNRLDPELPLANVRTMRSIVDASMVRTSFLMLTLLCAGALALFLGAVGIYGVIAYTVSRRMHEIGIRMALGARATDIQALILQRTARLGLAGIAAGIIAALVLTRLLRGLLYGVTPTDPLTLGVVAVLLFAIALMAGWLPARRSARADPLAVLKVQ